MIGKVSLTIIAILLCLVSFARADMTARMVGNIETMGIMNVDIDMTMKFSGDNMRIDNAIKMKSTQFPNMSDMPSMEMVTITKLKENQIYLITPAQKLYVRVDIDSLANSFIANKSSLPESVREYLGSAEDYEWEKNLETSDDPVEINGHKCVYKKGYIRGIRKSNPDETIRVETEFWGDKDSPLAGEMKAFTDKFQDVTGLNQADLMNNLKTQLPMFGDELSKFGLEINPGDILAVKMLMKIETTGGLLSPERLMGLSPKDSTEADQNESISFLDMSLDFVEGNTDKIDDNIFVIPDDYIEKPMDFNGVNK